MQFEKREKTNPSSGLVIVTAEPGDAEIRLTAGMPTVGRSVRVDSDLPVILDASKGDLGILSLNARSSEVFAAHDVTLQHLVAKSFTGEQLYVLFSMSVSGDVKLNGELVGERHFPYEIGGDLHANGISVDGHVRVAGDAVTPWHDTRSLVVAGSLRTPDELRAEGKVVFAFPGSSPRTQTRIEALRHGVSDRALARSVAALSDAQLTQIAVETGVRPLLDTAQAVAAKRLSSMPGADEDTLMDAIYTEWDGETICRLRMQDRAACVLVNAAMGTYPVGFGLNPKRAEEVKTYDSAYAFLSEYHEDGSHFRVDQIVEALDLCGAAFETQDDLDAGVFIVVDAMSDPRHETGENALAFALDKMAQERLFAEGGDALESRLREVLDIRRCDTPHPEM